MLTHTHSPPLAVNMEGLLFPTLPCLVGRGHVTTLVNDDSGDKRHVSLPDHPN